MDRDATILAHMPLVRKVARNIHKRLPGFIEYEDLVQAGAIGLVKAVDNWTPEHNAAVATYAHPRISGAIIDWLRSNDTRKRTEMAERSVHLVPLAVRVGDNTSELTRRCDHQHADPRPLPDALAMRSEAPRVVARLLATLKPRTQAIMRRYYFGGLLMKDVAKEFHVKESRVSQIHRRALELMREASKAAA